METQRINHGSMTFYREVYKDSPRWKGEDLKGKTVIVYMEQANGDCIQLLRYIPFLMEQAEQVYVSCFKELHPLLEKGIQGSEWVVPKLLDKTNCELPSHDYHVLSLSLSFLITKEVKTFPYLRIDRMEDLSEFDGRTKIGICWEGSPNHPTNAARSCPLRYFLMLKQKYPDCVFVCLQKEIHNPELTLDCEDMELYGSELKDYADTAALIKSVDFVVTVDTSISHLSGSLGKETHLLLSCATDGRYDVECYPSVNIWRNKTSITHNSDGTVDLQDPQLEKTLPGWDEVFLDLMKC